MRQSYKESKATESANLKKEKEDGGENLVTVTEKQPLDLAQIVRKRAEPWLRREDAEYS